MKNTNKKSSIKDTLIRIGAINEKNIEIFSTNTRDKENLKVYRDTSSEVIFIEDYYVGDKEYIEGIYRENSNNYEDLMDNERRFQNYKHLIANKFFCDYGCGKGTFLKSAKNIAQSVCGIEIQKNFLDELNENGINCYENIDFIKDNSLDFVSMFHCLEHLPNPTLNLKEIFLKLKKNGNGSILIEVPHAKDFLISHLELEDFKKFTLWSQHLVLHTRNSLRILLQDAGFKNIMIEGIQRYNLSNHLYWLKFKKPGGHKSLISIIESPELFSAYQKSLAKIDATDTLVALATT